MNQKRPRWQWMGAIALVVVILLTLLIAPSRNQISSGSTYSRNPSGYGAWYAYMEERGSQVQRWQQPFMDLLEGEADPKQITLLQVHSTPTGPYVPEDVEQWLRKGNTLIQLGVQAPVTPAEFRSQPASPVGDIAIATRRRQPNVVTPPDRDPLLPVANGIRPPPAIRLLGDQFGAVVWQVPYGKGQAIFSTTPHLAANAYQNAPNNYAFLAKLVESPGTPILVDEFLHGHRLPSEDAEGSGVNASNWFDYLMRTPLLPISLQGAVIVLLVVWAQNRRFGPPDPLSPPSVDNSQAYIQALAGVLQKANRLEFVLEMVGKEEQRHLQQALGLGPTLLDRQTLVAAWVEQTRRSADELEAVLDLPARSRRVSESEVLAWLAAWQALRRQLPR